MSDETNNKWYQNMPDLLKAFTALIIAITSLVIAWDKINPPQPPHPTNEPTVQPTKPPIEHPFDGEYQGIRGYSDTDRKSPLKHCLKRYSFDATIVNGTLTFKSDNRAFKGLVNPKGSVYIDETDVWPQPQQDLIIKGTIDNAKMTSAYCGNGYFRLNKQP